MGRHPRIWSACGVLLVLIAMLSPRLAAASDHGGGGGAETMVFTTNAGNRLYLQFEVAFESATPEAARLIGTFRPRIQHGIILLLSTKDVGILRTLNGKKELAAEMIALVNRVIREDHQTGVKEALFTRFLIQ